jgi:hypothetical protein
MSEQRHTISDLVDMARNEMIRLQYSHFTVENYSTVWRNLLKYAAEKGVHIVADFWSNGCGTITIRTGYLERSTEYPAAKWSGSWDTINYMGFHA